MIKHFVPLMLASVVSIQTFGQKIEIKEHPTPYKTSFKKDALITGAGIGLTVLGYSLITKKDDLTLAELATRTRDKVPGFDRGNAGFYSERADRDSYKPFNASFTYPILLALINGNERHHIGQVAALYLQTMSITGALFTLSAGGIHRSRPLVYESSASTDYKLSSNNQRSFFAGHTAATAAASFFAAQAFADFNPESKARTYVWIVAAATPALVGYLRYKAGMHFLSDNIIGYAVGAASGILVPKLHRTRLMENVSIIPQAGIDYKGLAVVYRFK